MSNSRQHDLTFQVYSCTADLACSTKRRLPDAEVHVYQIPLDPFSTNVSGFSDLLSADEKQRASRFHFEKNRNEYILGRGSLRMLLGSYVGVQPTELAFAYSEYGKPRLVAPASGAPLAFNVSHTEGMLMLAFTWRRRIGVDVERIQTDFKTADVADRFFSEVERRALAKNSDEDKPKAFFHCWTRKEAYIKALGEGVSHSLDSFDVCLESSCVSALLATRPDAAQTERWIIRDVPVTAGYVAAAAVETQPDQSMSS